MTTQHLVPARWRDELVLTLRLRDVSGAQIGDAVAHVESYCAESGESAEEAFGDARTYAQSLPFDAPLPSSTFVPLSHLLRLGVSLAGMFVTVEAVSGWVSQETPSLSLGVLVAVVVVVLVAVLVTRRLEWVVRHPWLGALALVPGMGVTMAALLLLDQPVLSVPPVPMTIFGILLLVGPSVWETARRSAADADLVVSPLDDPEDARRANGRSTLLAAWIIPLMSIPAVALVAVVAALA